jgi:hypothetical protein
VGGVVSQFQYSASPFQYPQPLPAQRLANARVVPDLASTMAAIPPGSVVANVGVRFGDLTDTLLKQPHAAKVMVMGYFNLHTQGRATAKLGGKQHREFIETRFAAAIRTKRLEIRHGRLDAIKALPAASVNAFFIRGGREFSALMAELYMCDSKLRSQGLIWVEDYIMADYTDGQRYDVVRAVNEFVAKTSYHLAYLVLDHTMFCTVVLRRPG